MSLPNFIIVGAAKSGTTSLYHCLRQHPEIFLPDVKEPHFFTADRELGFPTVTDEEEYRGLFADADAPLRGEASTGYLFFPESAEMIHAQIPDCKIVVMLRNPIDRSLSMWGHQVREGLEPLTLEEALEEEATLGGRQLDVDFGFEYLRLGFVAERLERFQELFGSERVKIVFYEDWVEDSARVLRDLFRFVDVDPEFRGHWDRRHNASGVPRFGGLHHFLNAKGPLRRLAVTPLRCALPAKVRHRIWCRLRDWNIRRGVRHVLRGETRSQLQSHFTDEIGRLEHLLDRDLSGWRQPATADRAIRRCRDHTTVVLAVPPAAGIGLENGFGS